MEYPVMLDGKQVGTVIVELEGLYLKFRCECIGLEHDFYRLQMIFLDKTLSLGLLILDDTSYILRTRIPKKLVQEDAELSFSVISERKVMHRAELLLNPGQPLEDLKVVRNGCLSAKNGRQYLLY